MPHSKGKDVLTDEQQEAFEGLFPKLLLQSGMRLSLLGYAGTGKTFLAGRLAEAFREEGIDVKVCAPTHQATEVLAQKIGGDVDSMGTVQSLLGLRLRPDGEGGYHLLPEGEPKLPKGGVVICDEASMIGADLWQYISARNGANWLFLGDPAQLAPVDEEPSPALHQPGGRLQEIVRQMKGSPIAEMGRRIRENEPAFTKETLRYDGEGGIARTRSRRAFVKSAIRIFENAGGEGYRYRIMTYRNRTADVYAHAIRQALYGEAAGGFVVGEWLVARDTWYQSEVPVVKNSEVFRVMAAERTVDLQGAGGEWAVWDLDVELPSGSERQVRVLCPREASKYEQALEHVRQKAIEDGKLGRRDPWKDYYRMREQYARVRSAVASTVHKAQGSTYETAFVDWRDLRSAPAAIRRPLRYVAVTRASRRLAIYR